MKSTNHYFFLLLLFFCLTIQAQNHQLTGTVTDAHGKPIDAALVWLITPKNNTCLAQAITNATGHYSITCIPKEVQLSVTCLGYTPYSSPVFMAQKEKRLATIILSEEAQNLGDVVITGEKIVPLLEQKAGKLVFNVANSINAQGTNAFELLRQTPGVSINDGTKSIQLHGRANVLVLLNGKSTYMQQAEVVNLLKSTPSSTIQSIEISSNASAKYDAAGSGGILNIVLKKEQEDGYNLTANVGLSYWRNVKQNTELSFNYHKKKINLYGNYSHRIGAIAYFYGGNREQSGSFFDTHSTDTDNRDSRASTLGLDYKINDKSQIGVRASYNSVFGPGIIWTTNKVYTSPQREHLLYSIYSISDYYHQVANTYSFNTNYLYKWSDKKEFNFDFDYSLFNGGAKNRQPNTYFSPTGQIDSTHNYRTTADRDIHLFAIAVNYKQTLTNGKLIGGIKLANVTSKNKYALLHVETDSERLDLNASNHFNYSERILAGYLLYDFNFGDKWQVNAGCRIEYTYSDGHLLPLANSSHQESHVKNEYVDLFPSIGVTYKLTKDQSLTASYGKRIDRPVYSDLNPIEQPLDGLSCWKGNPFLKPQKTHRFILNYLYKKSSLELSYSKIDDYRVGVTEITGKYKTAMTPKNLGTQTHFCASFSQSLRLFHAWDISLTGQVYHFDNKMTFDAENFYHRKRWSGSCTMQTSFPLFWDIRTEIIGEYLTKRMGGSTDIMNPNGYLNIGFQKKFMHKRAIVKLSLSDIFWNVNWSSTNTFTNFKANSYGYYESRLVKVNFTYKFGGSKKSYSKKSVIESELNRF